MSRSIHTTLQHVAEAKHWDFSEAYWHEQLITALEEETTVKRRVKRRVERERSAAGEPLYVTDTDLIPIVAKDADEYIHFPACVDDIRNVVRLLPRGVFDGVNEIELSLGVEYQDEDSSYDNDIEDPHTGRIGMEIIPGIYAARCQAIYTREECTIKVFAYVYAPDLRDREMWECYLRLHMFSSFVHEASHYYDSTERIARDRWRMENRRKVEAYAEEMQRDWMNDYILPYIETTYPDQVHMLLDWIEYYGGYKLPLVMIAGDPRAPWNDSTESGVSLFFDVSSNIEYLAHDVYKNKGLNQARIRFAYGLHYGEHYEPAIQIIERVLSDTPGDSDALTLKADIFVHQNKYIEAKELVDLVLKQNPNHKDAMWVQMDVCEEMQDWQVLLDVSTRMLTHFELKFWDKTHLTFHRAKAYLELGDLAGMNADIEAIEGQDWSARGMPKHQRRRIDELKAEAGMRGQVAGG